jgi:hypothetical protein
VIVGYDDMSWYYDRTPVAVTVYPDGRTEPTRPAPARLREDHDPDAIDPPEPRPRRQRDEDPDGGDPRWIPELARTGR